MFGVNPAEMIIIGVIAVLLFGSRLPEVGRSLGKSFVEFEKGINGVRDEINSSIAAVTSDDHTSSAKSTYRSNDDYEEPTAPKFEPPTSEPKPGEPAAS